jgi:hypothetical protein
MRRGHNHQSQGKFKHDAPRFKWQAKGSPAYTKSPDAAAYVAMCRAREIETVRQREARALELLEKGWLIFKIKKGFKPVIASKNKHASIRHETVARLEERGLIVAMGNYAYGLDRFKQEPVPPKKTTLELLAPAVARLPRTDAKAEAA